jgi:glyoxylase-like metal-dependent hydrolase (beta-lactamase superfamily II)
MMPLMTVEAIVTAMEAPAGMFGPEPVSIDTRCFLFPHAEGVVVIDVGPPGTSKAIEDGLARLGAGWSDVSEIVLTHSHFDHTGGLAEAIGYASGVPIRAGADDAGTIHDESGVAVTPLREGDPVRDLEVIATPGHTPGHICLLDEANSLLLAGDAVGNDRGSLSLGPPQFTADPVLARTSLERMQSMTLDRVLFSHGPEIGDPTSAIRGLLRGREDGATPG